ncbi:MAG: hypothetical protein JW953_14005 [Anaerolineae bacterium]|nr:hypothetical protein [Anaerolineae bacterium]
MYNQKYHQFDSFYNHKFGFHITGPRQDAFEAVLRVRPKVVKTLDFSVEVMKEFRKEIPDIFLIGRLFVDPQDYGQLSGGHPQHATQKGVEMAERILREEVNRTINHFNGRPIFHAWESLNEVFPENAPDDTHKLFDEYQVAFGEKMRREGFEPIAFNFGQGNGRGEQWLRLYPGTLEVYKYLGFHEYDWPTMDRLHRVGLEGPDEPENLVPGVGEGRGNDGMWRCLRYRRIMNEGIRQRYGNQHVCIITECGMTQGVWWGEDIGPWAKDLTVPPDIPGGVAPTPIPVDDYWQSLLWYNSELMKDDYVMGACLFVTGASGLKRWDTFEHLGPIMERIEAFQEEISLDRPLTGTSFPPARPIEIDPRPATVTSIPPVPDFEIPDIEPEVIATTGIEPAAELDRDADAEIDNLAGPVADFEIPHGEEVSPAPPPETTFETTFETEPEPEIEIALPPVEEKWQVKIERGPGLALLVGNIGLANEQITITRPGGAVERVISGSKPEYGQGGFEIYAMEPGVYKMEFLDQSFEITMSGQYTKANFSKRV